LIWDELVEDVTAGITDRRLAREARTELRDHLESATEVLVAEGFDRAAAETQAVTNMGKTDALARAFQERYRRGGPLWPVPLVVAGLVLGGIIAVGAGGPGAGAGLFVMLWALVLGALHPRSFVSAVRDPWPAPATRDGRQTVRAQLPFAVAGLIAGISITPNLIPYRDAFSLVVPGLLWVGSLEGARWLSSCLAGSPGSAPSGDIVAAAVMAVAGSIISTTAMNGFVAQWVPQALAAAALYLSLGLVLWYLHRLYRRRSALETFAPHA